jgi:hypothetical protein
MTFRNMNLDWLTCIQEFGVPLQMLNMTLVYKYQTIRFEFEEQNISWRF